MILYLGKDYSKLTTNFIDGDPSDEFNPDWIDAWMKTENFRIFNKFTDSHLFDIVDPKHPCSGGLTIDDVQRRLAAQVAELHLDERFATSKEVVSKQLAEGQKKMQSAMTNLWAEIEKRREDQKRKQEEQRANGTYAGSAVSKCKFSPATPLLSKHIIATKKNPKKPKANMRKFIFTVSKAPDLSHAQASVQAASSRAGAYLSSWGSWAAEKRKQGWGAGSGKASSSNSSSPLASPAFKPDEKKASLDERSGGSVAATETGKKEVVFEQGG